MLSAIIRFSIRNKLIIGLFTLAWLLWGILELSKLPIDALPDITSNQVQVITASPTLAAPEVERLITFPLEQSCSSIPGILEIRSISRFGLSVVTIVFGDETDIYWARQQVSEKLVRVRDEIPREAGVPELAPVTTGLGEIYQYVVRPATGYEGKYSLEDLRTIQDWIIRRQLLGTKGVADVSSFGGMLKQYEVAVDPARLKSHGLTISDVFAALEANNQNSGGAYIEKGPSLLFIRSEGLAGSIEEIRKIPVRSTGAGIPVLIRDIAEVKIGHAVRYGAMTFEDKGEVSGAVVLMLKGENASGVIDAIKVRMDQIRKTLPEGIIVETFLDRTKMVDRAIGTVKTNLLEGALIVIFVLVFFLGNLRAGLIVASVIPLSMMFAVGLMNAMGVSGNLMSLGALDFGLIVDGAVIIVEAVLHRLHLSGHHQQGVKLRQTQMDDAVEQSASRMMNAAVFGQIIILVVYLPILSLVGIEGKMFRPMAQTVAFALIGAFILSLTYVPMMTSLFLSKKLSQEGNISDRIMGFLQKIYHRGLSRIMRYPRLLVVSAVLTFILSLFVASRLGGEFIPELEEGDFAIDARLLTGTSLTETIRVSGQAAAVLRQFPEVERIVTRIGASEIPTDPMPMEMTDIIVSLKDKKQWTSAESYDELANKMSEALQDIPGLTAGFQYPVQMRFNELIAGARQDVVCKIFGEDLDSLAKQAAALGGLIRNIEGAKDIYVEAVTGLPQIVIRYHRDQMAMYGVSVQDVNRLVRAAFAGDVAGKIYENERRFDLVVRMPANERMDVTSVSRLLVPTSKGVQLPLYQLADVAIEEGPNQIQREDAKRRIIVAFNTRGRDVQSIVQELQKKVGEQMILPAGYYIKYGGQFENLMEARQRLMIAVPLALLLIFLMLYFAFGSIKYGLLIFSAIPLSAIGGILSLWLRDMPFSISAGVGFIALFGVAVLNGIVLITEFNRLKKESNLSIEELVMKGTGSRLRPVLMTAAVASLGFLPMALSQGAGAEVQRPLATVVIGGLVTATLLTLFVLPVLYRWFENRESARLNRGATALVLLMFLGSGTQAQEIRGNRMSLDSILAEVGRSNLSLLANRKNDAYWQTLSEKVVALPRTQAGLEYGNINSMKTDTRFFISQTIQLPQVYRRDRAFYEASMVANRATGAWRLREIEWEVRLIYADLQGLMERDTLLGKLDSNYRRFGEAAQLRLKVGETGLLEQTAAEAQVRQLQVQRQQLRSDMLMAQERLSTLLNRRDNWIPDGTGLDEYIPEQIEDPIRKGPVAAWWQAQSELIQRQNDRERSALSPEFTLGYSNLSLVGWQSPDGVKQQYFGPSQRFGIYGVNVGVPLFNGAARTRVKAGQIALEVNRIETANAIRGLEGRHSELLEQFRKDTMMLGYYQRTGLHQSDILMTTAAKSLAAGEISYIEWAMLMNQAVQIRSSYLDALQSKRKTIAEIIYLTGKK
jgi:cobalt-zinc-cadmium resistance protein CzcA